MLNRLVRRAVPLVAACAIALGLPAQARASTIGVEIFGNYGDGSPGSFSDFVGSFSTDTIDFTNWQPFGLTTFGAHLWGVFDVYANTGGAQFELSSNDGASFLVEGNLLLQDLGTGQHNLTTFPNGVPLWEAPRFPEHPFDVYFYSDGVGSPANLSLTLDPDVYYGDVPVPEPATLLLLGPAAAGLLARRRRAVV